MKLTLVSLEGSNLLTHPERGGRGLSGKSVVSAVSIPRGRVQELVSNALGPDCSLRLLTPERIIGLESLDGVKFLYDAGGTFLNEVNQWQVEQALKTHSRHTRATRSAALKAILGWFQGRSLRWQDCTELAHMNLLHRAFRSAEKPLVSKRTWNQWIDHWYPFLRFAQRQGFIDEIGFEPSDVRERGISAPRVKALSPAEFRIFLAGTTSQRMHAGCCACAGTGIRLAELASLRLSDVPDLNHPKNKGRSYIEAEIVGKGQKLRTIYWPVQSIKRILHYVSQERAIALEALIERVQAGAILVEKTYLIERRKSGENKIEIIERSDAPLWLAENGDPLSQNRWAKDFAKTSARTASEGVSCSPHQLRHTYATITLSMLIKSQLKQELIDTHLKPSGNKNYFLDPLREVKERLGHASLDTTMVYLDHIADHRALVSMAIEELEAAYFNV